MIFHELVYRFLFAGRDGVVGICSADCSTFL